MNRKTRVLFLTHKYDYSKVELENNLDTASFSLNFIRSPLQRGRVFSFLMRVHISSHFNKDFFKIPFKGVWSRFVFSSLEKEQIKEGTSVIFCYYVSDFTLLKQIKLFDYLKRLNKSIIVVGIYSDTVSLYSKIKLNLEKDSNILVTYNEYDAREYNIPLLPPRILDYSFVKENSAILESDIFYVGANKNRLDTIYNVFHYATSKGLKCDFFLTKVPKNERIPGIHYGKYFPYAKMLEHAKRSKCILNIMQRGATGITLRDYEAIGLNKILLTNDKSIKQYDFYTPEKVIFLENLENELYKFSVATDAIKWNNIKKYNLENYCQWVIDIVDEYKEKNR